MLAKLTPERKDYLIQLLKEEASRAVHRADPWAEYNIPAVTAERIYRHLYEPRTQKWTTDETIVKIEPEPFTHGAMRFCYRMKKRAQPPRSATNHRFHRHGWTHASNYVAKAYHVNNHVDASDQAKEAVRNDILLQYEAQFWATKFNEGQPNTPISFLRAYAIQFPDRPGQPWMAVERFIAGHDLYGAGFVKHNTNAGYVDKELRRVTPQVFSAFSFYISEGTRLVADIQGVGDLYTDPQVLSDDYRFGDGDLGPRGMAMFFKSFRHSRTSDAMGIPTFPLSKNELKVQAKYEEDELTLSDDELSMEGGQAYDNFARLDRNRLRRSSLLKIPRGMIIGEDEQKATVLRSNLSSSHRHRDRTNSFRQSMQKAGHHFHRSRSDVDEVSLCLVRATSDRQFSHKDFHRHESGELRPRNFRESEDKFYRSNFARTVSAPMMPTDRTMRNLGKVHYQLAVLHGMGRFPEVVTEHDHEPTPPHDSFSVLFHLSHAASLQHPAACLALARVLAGLDTIVSDLLNLIVPINLVTAKELLRRAMASPQEDLVTPKVAAGCLLVHLLQQDLKLIEEMKGVDEESVLYGEAPEAVSDADIMQIISQTLRLYDVMEKEAVELKAHKSTVQQGGGIQAGDRVEANYCLEGTFYPGTVTEVNENQITVCYDDDGSTETLTIDNVRLKIPITATQTNFGGPLSDAEAFGAEQLDDKLAITYYELQAELARWKEKVGELSTASALYHEAAELAMLDGKVKTATDWSLKAAEIEEKAIFS